MNLIERIKKHRKEYQDLYKKGVLGVGTGYGAHVNTRLFLSLSDGKYNVSRRDDSEYSYELSTVIDGLRVFAILTEKEYEREISKNPEQED